MHQTDTLQNCEWNSPNTISHQGWSYRICRQTGRYRIKRRCTSESNQAWHLRWVPKRSRTGAMRRNRLQRMVDVISLGMGMIVVDFHQAGMGYKHRKTVASGTDIVLHDTWGLNVWPSSGFNHVSLRLSGNYNFSYGFDISIMNRGMWWWDWMRLTEWMQQWGYGRWVNTQATFAWILKVSDSIKASHLEDL